MIRILKVQNNKQLKRNIFRGVFCLGQAEMQEYENSLKIRPDGSKIKVADILYNSQVSFLYLIYAL